MPRLPSPAVVLIFGIVSTGWGCSSPPLLTVEARPTLEVPLTLRWGNRLRVDLSTDSNEPIHLRRYWGHLRAFWAQGSFLNLDVLDDRLVVRTGLRPPSESLSFDYYSDEWPSQPVGPGEFSMGLRVHLMLEASGAVRLLSIVSEWDGTPVSEAEATPPDD